MVDFPVQVFVPVDVKTAGPDSVTLTLTPAMAWPAAFVTTMPCTFPWRVSAPETVQFWYPATADAFASETY